MPVVVLEVLAQDDVEVAWSGDQEVVEAFSAQGPDEPFRDRVRPGCSYRSADDLDVGTGEDGVEVGGELAVSVANKESEPIGAVAEIRTGRPPTNTAHRSAESGRYVTARTARTNPRGTVTENG